MKYRKDIDGLRTVAVVPVLLNHAGFSLFTGGYVGVDVFFVISGYLITIILVTNLTSLRDLAWFYERRARRILPALLAMILVSAALAFFTMQADDMVYFSKSLISTVLMGSNIFFWRNTGYFDVTSEVSPLIHTWSLGVEEQYYVLFPLMFLAFRRFGPQLILPAVLLIAVGSFCLSAWASPRMPSAAFFLLPSRAWELMIGAIAAIYVIQHPDFMGTRSRMLRDNALSAVGLTLIVYAVVAFDSHVPYPGVHAMVPTVGAFLIILFSRPHTLAGRLLSSAPFVFVGLISYSLYLWHQPALAFLRLSSIGEPSTLAKIGALTVAFVLAWASWRFVETPCRRKERIALPRFAVGIGLTTAVCLSVPALWIVRDGLPARFPMDQMTVASFKYGMRADQCWTAKFDKDAPRWNCNIGASAAAPRFFVMGDSHSFAFLPAFDAAASDLNLGGLFAGAPGCLPFLDVQLPKNMKECPVLIERGFDLIKGQGIKLVFLVANWTAVTNPGYNSNQIGHYLSTPNQHSSNVTQSRQAFRELFFKTLEAYKALGVKVVVMQQAPVQLQQAKYIYAKVNKFSLAEPQQAIREMSVRRASYEQRQEFVNGIFAEAAAQGLISLISPSDRLCDDQRCLIGTENTSYYSDDDHLSNAGALLFLDDISIYLNTL